jgi:hypothetical protein
MTRSDKVAKSEGQNNPCQKRVADVRPLIEPETPDKTRVGLNKTLQTTNLGSHLVSLADN